MEFLQVGELLTKTAELVLPPLLGIAAALLILRFLNPGSFARVAAAFRRASLHHHRLRSAREGLEPYGLGWLVPFGILFTFVVAVLGAHLVLAAAGDRIPPQVNRDDARLIPPTIDRDDRLLLLRKYPGAGSYQSAYDLAVKARELAGKKTFDDRLDYYNRLLRMAKYLALVALGSWVLRRRGGGGIAALGRLLAVLAVCAALWGAGLVGYLSVVRQSYQGRWVEIRNTLRVEGYSRPVDPPTADERRKMQDVAPRPWWNVSLHDD